MAFVIADRVRETTTTTGTGSVTLAGAYISFQSFSSAIGNGNSTYYTIANPSAGEWEVGIGTYTSGTNTLSRDTVLASSASGAKVTLSSGSKDVFVTQPAERSLLVQSAGSGLFAGNAAFTANGVLYANATTTTATGSVLTFDGAILGVNGVSVGRGAGAVATNTAVGASALAANTTGSLSTAVGYNALAANTSGYPNSSLGAYALKANTTGGNNNAFGYSSLQANTTGGQNIAFGGSTLYSNTTGANNTAIGDAALYSNTTASNNTAVGYQSLYANTTGTSNDAFGFQALTSNTTANGNSAFGRFSLYSNTTGALNVAMGTGAVQNNTTGSNNTGLGYQALLSNTTASNNTAVGYQAAYSNTTGGSNNTALGFQSAFYNNNGNNVSVGYQSMYGVSSASAVGYSTAIGMQALYSATTGSYNVAEGYQALFSNTTASYNTAVGYRAGYSNTTGAGNTSVGYMAGYSLTTEGYNTCIGYQAGYQNTYGAYNTFVGQGAGYSYNPVSSINGFNTFIGQSSGDAITTGTKNTIIGRYGGNQGGLDIRTASNYIVLSDGDGNPRFVVDSNTQAGLFGIPYSGWDTTKYRSLQFGNGPSARYFSIAQQYTAACSASLLWNAYGDGDDSFKYAITGDAAARMGMSGDSINFYGAPSGTAGNAISWSTLLGLRRNYALTLQGASQATGTGITFPATQSASSNANTLDDYEEGTWTPALSGSGTAGTFTYNTQVGSYTKIGNMVTLYAAITINTVSGSPTGDLRISGLPFACAAGTSASGAIQASLLGQSNINAVSFSTRGSSSYLYIGYINASNIASLIAASAAQASSIIDFVISYPT